MLQVNHIDFSYGRRKAPVFQDFSLDLQPGNIYGLLGKNGTGKSTLLYLLTGLLRPQHGEVLMNGVQVKERTPEILSDVFLVPEEFDLPSVTMEQYVKLQAPFYPRFSQEILDSCMKDFELASSVKLSSLSMGQKKKAFMSFALATNTRFLLMDEPTNGLDIPSKSIFRKVISSYMTDNRTLLISTHQVGDVDMLLDHVLILEGTRLLLNRSTADICKVLRYEVRPVSEPTDDALYVQPSIQGNALLTLKKEEDEETPLNLELLFNCALSGKLPQSLHN